MNPQNRTPAERPAPAVTGVTFAPMNGEELDYFRRLNYMARLHRGCAYTTDRNMPARSDAMTQAHAETSTELYAKARAFRESFRVRS